MASHAPYPVHVQGRLDDRISRWLWLVKWLLVIPHYIVLAFLWLAFVVLSVVAFFAILFTGRYPRPIFDFNLGVLRWSWRVAYYAYGALGTDRYPPFTLADVPDYPARLDVTYPQRLSRGLVLVKWWLLAIPHYIIVGIFVGGGAWVAERSNDAGGWQAGTGLIGILVLVSAVVLAFTGRYPRPLFDFILGMNRWALRVAGYAALMTDAYPPFRLDMGGDDPDGVLTLQRAAPSAGGAAQSVAQPAEAGSYRAAPGGPPPRSRWTAGRVTSVVVGAMLALLSMGLLAGGGAALWADSSQRDADGYLTTDTVAMSTGGYALRSENLVLHTSASGPGWTYPQAILDDVRLRAESREPGGQVFIGVARTAQVNRYLAGVEHATVIDVDANAPDHRVTYRDSAGGPPAIEPAGAGIWAAQAAGPGRQSLEWSPESGRWTIVVMNADAARGVSADVDAAARIPGLPWVGAALLAAGILLLVIGVVFIAVAVARASRTPEAAAGPSPAAENPPA